MKIVGHRGARGLAPENTIASFKKALEYAVDEIECDARVTKSGQVVLHHDPFLVDQSGARLEIASHSFSELVHHKPDLTTLDQVIKLVDRKVPLVIEVKPDVTTSHVITIVKRYLADGWQATDFRLASYSQPVLLELHAALPDIQKIVIENWSSLRAYRRARQLGTNRLSMLEYWLWSGFISSMRRRGFELYSFPPKDAHKENFYAKFGLTGYTNNPRKAQKWAKHGLTGVITDYPDRFAPKK